MKIVRLFLLLLIVGAVAGISAWTTFTLHTDIANRLKIHTYNAISFDREKRVVYIMHGYAIRIEQGCAIVDKPKYQAICEVFAVQEE